MKVKRVKEIKGPLQYSSLIYSAKKLLKTSLFVARIMCWKQKKKPNNVIHLALKRNLLKKFVVLVVSGYSWFGACDWGSSSSVPGRWDAI